MLNSFEDGRGLSGRMLFALAVIFSLGAGLFVIAFSTAIVVLFSPVILFLSPILTFFGLGILILTTPIRFALRVGIGYILKKSSGKWLWGLFGILFPIIGSVGYALKPKEEGERFCLPYQECMNVPDVEKARQMELELEK